MSLVPHLGDHHRGLIHPEDPGEIAGPGRGHRRISVTSEEGMVLAGMAAGRWVLEVGTGLGVATRYLAMHAAHVTTLDIDPWVREKVWPTLPDRVTALDTPPTVMDVSMAFIDAEHTPEALCGDVMYAAGLMSAGGVLVAHDAIELRETLRELPGHWHILDTRYGLGICVLP